MSDISKLLVERLSFFKKHSLKIPNVQYSLPNSVSGASVYFCYDAHLSWMRSTFHPRSYELFGGESGDTYVDPDLVPRGDRWRYDEIVSKGDIINGVYELISSVSTSQGGVPFRIVYGQNPEFVRTSDFVPNKKYSLSISIMEPGASSSCAYVHIGRNGTKVGHVIIPIVHIAFSFELNSTSDFE